MADQNLPTPEELRNLLAYDPETGILTWRERPIITNKVASWNARFAGKVAGCFDGSGYYRIEVDSKHIGSHRAAWAIAHGQWPQHHIDHINGIKTDNRISNLRDVTIAENNKNRPRQANNTSGCTGVYWHKQNEKWRAKIKIDGWWKWLGDFPHKFDAIIVRLNAEKLVGFTPRHGMDMPDKAA